MDKTPPSPTASAAEFGAPGGTLAPPQIVEQLSELLRGAPALGIAACASLLAYGLLVGLRESLWHSVPARVLEACAPERRTRIERLLSDGESLAIAAGLAAWCAALACFAFLCALAAELTAWGTAANALVAAAVAAPLCAAIGEALAPAFAASEGDAWLARRLPTAALLLAPVRPVARLLAHLEHFVRGQFDLPSAEHARRIVEDLRDTIEDSEIEGDLGETSREILENVIELQDVDAAAIMTPRTEMHAVPRSATLREALNIAAEAGHGRLPVYEESLDAICGTFSTREGLEAAASGRLDETLVAELTRPAVFIPETKQVTELLGEFRRQATKLAIVLDEYGGTAGLVTLSDVLEQLVGELRDEFDEAQPESIRRLPGGGWEIDASERVSDVNEELELELPEEADFETVGGFVLAHLGRFPREGESFRYKKLNVQVTRASDRRVLEVRLLPAAELSA